MFLRRLLLLCLLPAVAASARAVEAPTPEMQKPQRFAHRWFYVMTNLRTDENVPKLQALLKRAKAAGYNGMVITDVKFSFLNQVPEAYFRNARAVNETARELGIDVYPVVCGFGYEGGVEFQDPNLAEGLPVRDALFVVRDGHAALVPESEALQNGDFETVKGGAGDTFSGWSFQDGPGQSTFRDTQEKHGGESSVRMENIMAGNPNGNARMIQSANVKPWRQYHLSVWVKTQDWETPGNTRALALSPEGKVLAYVKWNIARTQDWTHYDCVFNSLNNEKVSLYCGVWGGRGGKIWWDDAQFEEIGLTNLLRRPGCPLVVKGENGVVYEEGRDFLPVRDPKSGHEPWAGAYGIYHEPPAITLTPNSRISGGQRLRVSFYSVITVDGESIAQCPSEPKFYDLTRDEITRVNDLWHPRGFFLAHDEIRQMNWCDACQKRGLTPGQLLADNVRRCAKIVREVNAKAELYAWSDMFDPFHNATDDYYLVNGSLKNSWEGLDANIGVTNWNFEKREQSLPFFADRGHHQVLAGYYDSGPEQIRDWTSAAKTVKNVDGVMYTTWQGNYNDLETFAKNAWGEVPGG